jgi:glycine/D-amino acid oxidase-like deaminating enzyme
MTDKSVVICGAGIAGISTAYHLAVQHGLEDVVLIDERPPLSLTSDKSSECYRNWWPGPGDGMVSLMNRSIDLLERLADHHNNAINLNRRGYVYFTADPDQISNIEKKSSEISSLGAGPLRIYRGDSSDPQYQPSTASKYSKNLKGADLILDNGLLQEHFPYITPEATAALHIRRAGWFSAQQLGSLLLEQSRKQGVHVLHDRVVGGETSAGKLSAVKLESGESIATKNFVIAAGPFATQVAESLDIQLPVFNELHLKASLNDHLNIIPRQAPLLIWNEAQLLPWNDEEVRHLSQDKQYRRLLGEFPPGVHTRPEGGPDSQVVLMVWEYQSRRSEPILPPKLDAEYPEITMRGLSRMIPDLRQYFNNLPRPFIDGGYYTKTRENRPLIGPLQIEGCWLIGALSGFGLMASMAAGELLALHVLGKLLPAYASAFMLSRYHDRSYLKLIDQMDDSGQL